MSPDVILAAKLGKLLPIGAASACVAALLPLAAQGQALVVTPSLTLTETATTNRALRSEDPQADLISLISPGLSVVSRRGAVQGSLAYSLNGVVHAREASLNNVYHNLAAAAQATGYDGRLGLAATANANRQIVSAYGTQGIDPSLSNENQAQVFSYGLRPYFTGRLLGDITYRAQLAYNATHTDGSSLGDTRSLTTSVSLNGRKGTLSWVVDGSRQIAENADRPRSHNGSVGVGLSYQPDIDWNFGLRVGSDVDDLRTGRSERTATWGVGVAWSPTPRTKLKVEVDERFYGRSHLLSLSHRFTRLVLSASDSRSLQTGGVVGRSTVSNYDLFFQQLASTEPDPVRRDALVRGLLTSQGLDPNAQVVAGGFLSGGPTVTRARNLTSAYQGIRSTLTVTYVVTATESIGVSSADDDLASVGRVRQKGFTVSWSHRMTPESSLLVIASSQRTPSASQQSGNDLRTISATWTGRLGQHTSVSLGVRHVTFDGEPNPYQESALLGSLRMQF